MDNNIIEINDNLSDLDKDNKFCSQSENKNNNKKEIKEQIIKMSSNSNVFYFKTNSYGILNGKINLNWSKEIKRDLVTKYWVITPNQKYEFYGNEIKKIWKNKTISELKNLIGILMIFRNFLTQKEIGRFDNYFSIKIKSNERQYYNNNENGKILYIGGDLKEELGKMLKDEFGDYKCSIKDNSLPLFISIMVYNEYEEIELDAIDYCDKNPEHDGFGSFKIFNQKFHKDLSKKVKRTKREKNEKKQKLLEEEKKSND